jgi:hypothetical protein
MLAYYTHEHTKHIDCNINRASLMLHVEILVDWSNCHVYLVNSTRIATSCPPVCKFLWLFMLRVEDYPSTGRFAFIPTRVFKTHIQP